MKKGFTLAELLIALTILGVIATFTIPKVLQSQQDEKRESVFKEILASLQDAAYKGIIQGQLRGNNNISYFRTTLNAVKTCSDADSDGCWDATVQGTPFSWCGPMTNRAGVNLHNGATIAGFNNWAGNTVALVVDWNGTAGPNQENEDQIEFDLCLDPVACNTFDADRPKGPGTMNPSCSVQNKAAFNKIFE